MQTHDGALRATAAALVAVLALSPLAGCKRNTTSSTEPTYSPAPAADTASAPATAVPDASLPASAASDPAMPGSAASQ
jgi:hypothetical protein